jgi:glycosyltransferase involved in cell wall biosynthesis
MAAGLPVVATGVGGTVEILKDEENSLLVQPGDAEGMARRLVRALTDEDLRGRLVAQGRQTSNLMSVDRTVKDYLALYAQTIRTKKGTA